MNKLIIYRVPETDILLIRQEGGNGFFISADNGLLISISSLINILTFLVKSGIISVKVIEGILEEVK